MSGVVIPIRMLDTFGSQDEPMTDGYPTAYARAKAEHDHSMRKVTTMQQTSAGSLVCPDCQKEFGGTQGLAVHRSRIHHVPGANAKKPSAASQLKTATEPDMTPGEQIAAIDEIVATIAVNGVLQPPPLLVKDAAMLAAEPVTLSEAFLDLTHDVIELYVRIIELTLLAPLGEAAVKRLIDDLIWPLVEAAERSGEAGAVA